MSAVVGCCAPSSSFLCIDESMLMWVERISAVALGVFAAYADLPWFLLASGFGFWIGMTHSSEAPACRNVSCSQGLLEQLTGVRLPAVVSLACNIAMTCMHITHHAQVVVPIVGIAIGAWAGREVQLMD